MTPYRAAAPESQPHRANLSGAAVFFAWLADHPKVVDACCFPVGAALAVVLAWVATR
jgi:hypothetical protein